KYDRIDDMVEQQSEPGPRHIERLEGRLPDEREGEEDKTEAERPPAYLPRLLAQQRREREDPEHDSHDDAKRPFRRSLDLFLAIEFLMHANPSPSSSAPRHRRSTRCRYNYRFHRSKGRD